MVRNIKEFILIFLFLFQVMVINYRLIFLLVALESVQLPIVVPYSRLNHLTINLVYLNQRLIPYDESLDATTIAYGRFIPGNWNVGVVRASNRSIL